ncbi:tetratricopeptide repeat protein [Anaerobacterium chartisolvens]|uniref:Tetratricopeptide repeat protein n=1 Tax=Anaerobacterium chartisolvens TaxID=1297424 RepID=A0A369B8P6_9FIRM|nr:glycosyltransferase family 2 protein [Anaerobacterium chartisolvens]RCX16907.1 tetratricopeptide repeat protein [Anaerobacterium chartisolvens]
MATFSLCMIVKNEEDTLSRCLETVKDIVDEIIIIDTGSTDKTKEIASEFTSRIYDFEWIDDFSAARNYSFSKATMDYIMWLDADDVILEEDRKKLKKFKSIMDKSIDIVMMKYNVGFDASGKVTLSYFRERLFKRANNYTWNDPIHEHIPAWGKVINSDICITHKKIHASPPQRNLKIFRKMIEEGKPLSPRNLFYCAREFYHNGLFDDAIEYFNKFLDSGQGWVEDNISACFDLSKCYSEKKDTESSLKALFRSFQYEVPRAEICCQIGYYFKNIKQYEKALFWFDLALNLKKPQDSWGFILHDYWGYIPLMELCVCHDRLGNHDAAMKCNDLAGEIKPNDSAVLYNKNYFNNLKKEQK